VRASFSIVVELDDGCIAIIRTAFDLTTYIAIPALFALPVVLYSMADSPIPETGFALDSPKAPVMAAAICSGRVDLAVFVSGNTMA